MFSTFKLKADCTKSAVVLLMCFRVMEEMGEMGKMAENGGKYHISAVD